VCGQALGWYTGVVCAGAAHTHLPLSLSHTVYIKVKKNVERIITTFLVWVSKLDPTKDNETALSFAVPNHDWKNLKAHQMIDTR
jgi:hypothetical protein